jgi:aspartokinase/homoserine dehydrogenase 1
MTTNRWEVHKFGGTSVATASLIVDAVSIVTGALDPRVSRAVVVSALAGTTDTLIEATDLAVRKRPEYLGVLGDLAARTLGEARALLEDASGFEERFRVDRSALEDILRGVYASGICADATRELVAGHGEVWSAAMFHARLVEEGRPASMLDARDVLVVERNDAGPAVDWDQTRRLFGAWLDAHRAPFLVITGYVARDRTGTPTTLMRNGSDLSASIFGRLLEADSITIWTDVDGVMSADPRRVPEARLVPELSYEEAMELAYFGAGVLHPQTMGPAVEGGIPIWIRNARRQEVAGTVIRTRPDDLDGHARSSVRGLSSVQGMAILNLEGAGMIGVPGIASRLFGALHEARISVTLISQASSEHSICLAVPVGDGERARQVVERAFAPELLHKQIQRVEVSGPYGILAAVGDEMVRTPGVAARFFGALGRAGVNIRAIAQGSSERNISAVVSEADATRALRAVHSSFYLSDQTLSVGLIGPGLVGSELLRQFARQVDTLRSRLSIDLKVRAITGSKRMVLSEAGIDLASWKETLASSGEPADLDRFTRHVRAPHLPHAVVLDCTASREVAARTAEWLSADIHVITPNKLANTGAIEDYRKLRELGGRLSSRYLYEATVGAGLPVISTLRDFLETGDRVLKIEGMFSGTLSFILDTLSESAPFSNVVAEARSRGYSEPDPREDLSGMDVARKAVILAREVGLDVGLGDLDVESLVPPALANLEVQAFMERLGEHNAAMESRRAEAAAAGQVLRYVASIEAGGRVEVGLGRYPADSMFGRAGVNNVVIFTTERYQSQPLVVQGPGAGPEVTAAGIFGDLLRLAASLGSGTPTVP